MNCAPPEETKAPNKNVYETAETLRVVAKMLDGIADALEQDDEIMGALCSQGLVYNLPALPKNIRDVIAEWVTDEAALGFRADQLLNLAIMDRWSQSGLEYIKRRAWAIKARETAE